MRQPPPRTAIRTIRQPLTPRYGVTSSPDVDSFDDDVTLVVHDSPHDVGCDEKNDDAINEKLSPEAEPRRRLASLTLASGTGEDVAALGANGPRPRLRLAIKPFRVLAVFLAVLLIVLWGWLALRIAPSSELASGDGLESSSHTQSDKSADEKTREKLKDDEESALGTSQTAANRDKKVATEEVRDTLKGGSDSTGISGTVVIYVSGAVRQPGVYTLAASSRVNDAVTAAGGMTENADPAGINLAAQLEDSQHVHIPEPGETPIPSSSGGFSDAMGTGSGSTGGLININTAGENELQELPGIGPALSSAIVQWRDEHGSFASVDDLLDVPGVGPAKLSQLRARATV